jgi:hypothetical protein
MWAQKIQSMQGRQFRSKKWSPVTSTNYSDYTQYRFHVIFWTPPYDVWSDRVVGADFINGFPGNEWLRFCGPFETDTGIENINRPGTYLRWANVGGAAGPGRPPAGGFFPVMDNNTSLPSGIVIRTPKEYLKITWHQVPAIGLTGKSGWGRPRNMNPYQGYVNEVSFPPSYISLDANNNPVGDLTPEIEKYPAETLLFLKPTKVAEAAPVAPELMSPFLLKHIPRTFRVTFHFLFFDPPTDPRPAANGTHYPAHVGHNGAPLPGSASGLGANSGDYFYRVSTALDGSDNFNGNPANRLYPLFNPIRLWFFTYPY